MDWEGGSHQLPGISRFNWTLLEGLSPCKLGRSPPWWMYVCMSYECYAQEKSQYQWPNWGKSILEHLGNDAECLYNKSCPSTFWASQRTNWLTVKYACKKQGYSQIPHYGIKKQSFFKKLYHGHNISPFWFFYHGVIFFKLLSVQSPARRACVCLLLLIRWNRLFLRQQDVLYPLRIVCVYVCVCECVSDREVQRKRGTGARDKNNDRTCISRRENESVSCVRDTSGTARRGKKLIHHCRVRQRNSTLPTVQNAGCMDV